MRTREHLYFLPIGGTATAPLAGLLREMGHFVEGVDSQLYPPMSTLLEELEIPVRLGFDSEKIPTGLDRVIIGNAVPRSNPEVISILERNIAHLSQAEAVAHYVLARGQQSLVVAGSHGKTTTSAMLAWILEYLGHDPSYLVGGLPKWNPRGFRIGSGQNLVIEGDEYNTAFFDRGPKFLHYRPHLFLLGPVEYDHADLYPSFDAVLTSFRAGAAQVPRDGAIIVNAWSQGALDACRDATARVVRVGSDPDCDFQLLSWEGGAKMSTAELRWEGERWQLRVKLPGLHNLQNAAVACGAALTEGLSPAKVFEAIESFPGVARRMDTIGEVGRITVVDDFAHHPTALRATIEAARQHWPDRRLAIAFEPRSLTAARRDFQQPYLEALSGADLVLVVSPFHKNRLDPTEVLDRELLARDLNDLGVTTIMPEEGEDAALRMSSELVSGDVVVGCSSGSFDGFHLRLLDLLGRKDQ